MSTDRETELRALEAQMDEMRERLSYWKGAQDGSYEMALHYNGYDKLLYRWRELAKELQGEQK